jgi:hypothetical protein
VKGEKNMDGPRVRAVDEQRRERWLRIAGTDELPVRSEFPEESAGPDGNRGPYYELDFRRLTEEQYTSFARAAAADNDLPFVYIYLTLHRDGVKLEAMGLELVEEGGDG